MIESLKILGLTQKATLEDVKKAYRRKAKVLHPDINSSKKANEQFVQLQDAYNYLVALFEQMENFKNANIEQTQKYEKGTFNSFYSGNERKQNYRRYKQNTEQKKLNLAQLSFAWLIHIVFFIFGFVIAFVPMFNLLYNGIQEDTTILMSVIGVVMTFIIGISISGAMLYSFKINIREQ